MSIVTGALGYTGKYIAQRLLSLGQPVRTLTGHPHRPNPFGDRLEIAPLDFADPSGLTQGLQGAEVLYNTYWIRFSHRQTNFDHAVRNGLKLIEAAREARVRRIVHISIAGASADSPLPYFRGKGLVEEAIIASGLSYAIIRPTVIFGKEDLLINNIAWFLRRFPIFPIFGSGEYRVQPVFVEDVAEIAVNAAHAVLEGENLIVDAVGPETFSFEEMVRLIADRLGARTRLVHLRPRLALALSRLMGVVLRDVVITRDEIEGLMAELLISREPPTGSTRLGDWLERSASTIGKSYASELSRHYR